MAAPDTSHDGIRSTTNAEHISDAKSKKVTLRQFEPSSGDFVNISAVDNGDGTFSLSTRTTGTVTVIPQRPSTPTVTTVADTTTSTTLISANTSRREVEFFNTSTAILYLLKGTGTASATNFTVQLNQGDYYSTDITSAFQGVWASDAGGSVLITESI